VRTAKPTSRRSEAALAYVALLRGINVGGRNRLQMAALARMFVEAGCQDVRTYIQSGNVVFSAGRKAAEALPEIVPERIAERFGIKAPVILRSSVELGQVVAGNPFLAPGMDAASLHVAFLAHEPEKRRIAALDPARSRGDSFAVRGREIYLHLPNGVARTKLTNAYFDTTLATVSTLRNWRTVLKLLEMAV
jgi:uncharacterized protein (DUF1697 family)